MRLEFNIYMKTTHRRLRRRKRKQILFEDQSFHSQFELDCYLILLKHFPRDQIIRQRRYFPNDNTKKHTCDFYFPNLKPITWLEVSNYLKPRTYIRIKKKRSWIESRMELFIFISSLKQLEELFSNND